MAYLKKIWNTISFSGINNSMDSDVKKKIILCNRIAISAGLLVSLTGINFIKVPTMLFTMTLASITYTSAILFNRFKWYNVSRFILVVTPPIFILIGGGFLTDGPNYSYRYSLISVIITPLLLFQISEKVKMWIGTAWVLVCFILYDVITKAIPRLPQIAKDVDVDGPMFITFGGFFSLFFLIIAFYYLMDINKKYEKRLGVMLKNTKQKNLLISEKRSLLETQYQSIQNQQEVIEKMNETLRSKVLKAQMNPHFIFNCLNSIQHFVMQNDAASAMGYISKFSKLMRRVLENSTNENVSVADEIKTLTYYIELEQLRYNNGFNFEFIIDEQLDQLNTEMPSMLLQPFVENSIIHGLRSKTTPGLLKIMLLDQHEHLLCVIEDNGIGRAAAAKLKSAKNIDHKSRAIDINTERIFLMQKNATIITQDLNDADGHAIGTRVEINIPINN
jgi:hypothetical protein